MVSTIPLNSYFVLTWLSMGSQLCAFPGVGVSQRCGESYLCFRPSWWGGMGHISSTWILFYYHILSSFLALQRVAVLAVFTSSPPIHSCTHCNPYFAFIPTFHFSYQDGQWAITLLLSSKGMPESLTYLTMSRVKHPLLLSLMRTLLFLRIHFLHLFLGSSLGSLPF